MLRTMKKISFILLCFLISFQSGLVAQNYIWLNNGKKMKIGEFKIENTDIISYRNLKGKAKFIQTYDVFSVVDSSGIEKVIYTPDTSYQGAFTVPEMRSFVQGEYDANQKFKSPWTTIGGVVVAGASSVVINPVYVFLISTGYTSVIGLTKPSDKKLKIPTEFINNEHYKLGYKKEVKHKRIKNAIIGSGIGLIVGIGTYVVINK
jgi:hypothetical protein